jgi:hypothetical protein
MVANTSDNILPSKKSQTELVGFWTFSIVWYSREHDVSETGSVSVLRWMGQGRPTQLGPLERANLNHWRCLLFHLHLRTEIDPVFETSCCLEYQTMEKVQKPSNSVLYTIARTD